MGNFDQRVRKIVAEQLGVNEADIKNDSVFVDDLGANSLDTIKLMMALEEEFVTEIPDNAAERITTVQKGSMSFRVESHVLTSGLPARTGWRAGA